MNLNRFLNSQTKTVSQAAGILMVSALISRLLGLIRDWLLAKNFGAEAELDIYFAAFKIPDFVYNVLILGGILVAFLPLFSEYFSKNKKEAWDFTSNCLNIFLFLLVLFSLLLFIFSQQLVNLIAPGFDSEKLKLTIFLTRLMLVAPIFFGLSSIFSGILQYFNRFLVYGLSPIFYNLGIIFGILFLTPQFSILGVVMGVIFGSFLHLAIQIPSAIICGFRYRPIFNFKDPGIKKIFLLMLPRTFGIAAQQINLIFINAIASTLAVGSIAIFNLANNISHLPIGIFGVSFAIAAFPAFSRVLSEEKKEEFIRSFSLVFRRILYLIIPISFFIFILREQIVEIILRHGQFSQAAAKLTAESLGLFCLGIFAQSLIPLFLRAFFSFQDTKTPTLITVTSMALNIALSYYFVWTLKFSNSFQFFIKNVFSLWGIEDITLLGLPLAFSIASIFQFILLAIFLYKKIRKH